MHLFPPEHTNLYTPYESPSLANQINRKLGVFNRKLQGIISILCYYVDIIRRKWYNNVK